ncbi:MAG: alpha-galactosidase [Polyangiaceae bacterium]|nr:alpha-galactosidase [Polyangiaceae bacterium]
MRAAPPWFTKARAPARGRGAPVAGALAAALAALGGAAHCGPQDGRGPESSPCSGGLSATAAGVEAWDRCLGELVLHPRVRLAEGWREPSGECVDDGVPGGASWRDCPMGDVGFVRVSVDQSVVTLALHAARAATVEGIALEGVGELRGATSWLSNGLQSWSQSGVIAIDAPPSEAELAEALGARGDGEVMREGRELSWGHTFAGGGEVSLFAGAISERRFRTWASVHREGLGDDVRVRLVSGASGERIELQAGDVLEAEPWYVELGGDVEAAARSWSDRLSSRARDAPRPAPAGWNSWYELWDTVDEPAVRANAPLARDLLAPLLPPGAELRVVIDDGWQLAWGDWEPNAKFPSGLASLTAELGAGGFRSGIWLAPLLVAEGSDTATRHPEWLVGGASYKHGKHGVMRVLDVTHPEAAQHLTQVISRLVAWGFDLLKIDFLFAGSFEGQRYSAMQPMEAYHRALELIRAAAGEETLLVAVGAPGLASLPHVDGWRVGGDIALEASDVAWAYVPSQARSVAARWPLCRAVPCDADPVLARRLEPSEVDALGYVVALAGGALFLSDDLRDLPAERRGWGLDARRAAWALSSEPAVPLDPFPASPPPHLTNAVVDLLTRQTSHVVPREWALSDGSIVLLNVGDEPVTLRDVELPPRSAAVK